VRRERYGETHPGRKKSFFFIFSNF
jgi:hypothetical protein